MYSRFIYQNRHQRDYDLITMQVSDLRLYLPTMPNGTPHRGLAAVLRIHFAGLNSRVHSGEACCECINYTTRLPSFFFD